MERSDSVMERSDSHIFHISRFRPTGATETIRTVCKETLQSLVTTFTNMELEIRVKRFTRMAEAIANYVGRENSKEMKLLVKTHQKENEPKEPVMPGKEEAKSPFMMKKNEKILFAEGKIFVIDKGKCNNAPCIRRTTKWRA
jgi:hypothetical protein